MSKATIAVKVWGFDGHRQRTSFEPSVQYDFGENGKTRLIAVLNSDITGTNDYSIMMVTRDTMAECEDEVMGQIYDGVYENSRIGKIEILFKRED